MIANKKGKKMKIKYSPNLDVLALNSKEYCENHTLEGIGTKHERIANEVLKNPNKFRKK